MNLRFWGVLKDLGFNRNKEKCSTKLRKKMRWAVWLQSQNKKEPVSWGLFSPCSTWLCTRAPLACYSSSSSPSVVPKEPQAEPLRWARQALSPSARCPLDIRKFWQLRDARVLCCSEDTGFWKLQLRALARPLGTDPCKLLQESDNVVVCSCHDIHFFFHFIEISFFKKSQTKVFVN